MYLRQAPGRTTPSRTPKVLTAGPSPILSYATGRRGEFVALTPGPLETRPADLPAAVIPTPRKGHGRQQKIRKQLVFLDAGPARASRRTDPRIGVHLGDADMVKSREQSETLQSLVMELRKVKARIADAEGTVAERSPTKEEADRTALEAMEFSNKETEPKPEGLR